MRTNVCAKCKSQKEEGLLYQSYCRICKRAYNKVQDYYAKNREAVRQRAKNRYRTNDEYRSRVRKAAKLWQQSNVERAKVRVQNWHKRNPDKVCAYTKNRRNLVKTRRFCATVEDKQIMLALYRTAQQMTRDTGIRYEVDHILPLRAKLVSGLHTPFNLQIITKTQNCRKRAEFNIQ